MRYFTLCFALLSFTLSAQPPESAVMDVGRLRVHINQDGRWGSDDQAFLEWQKDDGDYVSILQQGGIHYGAQTPGGDLQVAVLDGTDNEAGGLGVASELVGIFKVTKEDILAHLADFADNSIIDNPIPAIYSWPALGNPFFEEYNGGMSLPTTFQGVAGFWDSDGNGLYDPSRGDTPYFDVRGNESCGPTAVPNQMYWLNFRSANNQFPNVVDLDIQMTIASYDCIDVVDTELNNRTVLIHYKIINRSLTDHMNTYFGYRTQAAIGAAENDALGTDTSRTMAYFYQLDEQDDQFGNEKVPAVGIGTLRGPLNEIGDAILLSTALPDYDLTNGPPALGEAITLSEAYNLIQGNWLDGSPLTTGGLGYQSGDISNGWAFPGEPGDDNAWTYADVTENSASIGVISSFAPFTLMPGAVNEVILAITVNNEGDNQFDRVDSLKQDFSDIGSLDDTDICQLFADCATLPSNSTETLLPTLNVTLSPNPVNNSFNLQLPEGVNEAIVSVTDINGRLWLQSSNALESINVSSLPSGLYFATVRTERGQRTLRFVKE